MARIKYKSLSLGCLPADNSFFFLIKDILGYLSDILLMCFIFAILFFLDVEYNLSSEMPSSLFVLNTLFFFSPCSCFRGK